MYYVKINPIISNANISLCFSLVWVNCAECNKFCEYSSSIWAGAVCWEQAPKGLSGAVLFSHTIWLFPFLATGEPADSHAPTDHDASRPRHSDWMCPHFQISHGPRVLSPFHFCESHNGDHDSPRNPCTCLCVGTCLQGAHGGDGWHFQTTARSRRWEHTGEYMYNIDCKLIWSDYLHAHRLMKKMRIVSLYPSALEDWPHFTSVFQMSYTCTSARFHLCIICMVVTKHQMV